MHIAKLRTAEGLDVAIPLERIECVSQNGFMPDKYADVTLTSGKRIVIAMTFENALTLWRGAMQG